ncbi:MAG: radical SAM protein [Myxococcota bacterium]|nr:radical SAM protein [Myxococcota bacterium]
MEPRQQVEIQLGHMCNNRCVFCVSGQRTAMGEAGPMPTEPILEAIRDARARGHAKITLLGGEPTLQPGFLDVVRECARLGFEEVVVFTNGAKTANAARIDELLATGAPITWRISIQGATERTHDRTTRKDGSFARIVRTLEHLAARQQRATVNMCVVGSNHEDVDRFAELLPRHGVVQLHLDLMRPRDAGQRTEDELREMMPSFRAMVPPMSRAIADLPPDFDVNLGNLPYCVAPHLAPWIHHDGERTETIAIDGDDRLSRPWNKYLVKRTDKLKTTACASCAFEPSCSGVFDRYVQFHGAAELVPIRLLPPASSDPSALAPRRAWMHPALASALSRLRAAAPFGAMRWLDQRLAPDRAELSFEVATAGAVPSARVVFWIDVRDPRQARTGYRVEGEVSEPLREGLLALVTALRTPSPEATEARA